VKEWRDAMKRTTAYEVLGYAIIAGATTQVNVYAFWDRIMPYLESELEWEAGKGGESRE
jgi:hypothetical protein